MVGDATLRRRGEGRSCDGRVVGGLGGRGCGEDRCRCGRAAPEAVAALADTEHGEAYEYDATVRLKVDG